MNVAIFGLGYVGCVSAGCLAQIGHHIIGVDINQIKVDQINSGKPTIIEKDIDLIIEEQWKIGRLEATTDPYYAIMRSEIIIVAVGTPSTERGHLNLEYIFKVAEDIGRVLKDKANFLIIAIRSTIITGTCDKFASIVENFSGKKKNIDFSVLANPEFLREGSAVRDYSNPPFTLIGADNNKFAEKLAVLYKNLPGEIIITDLKVAELMKYVNNTFHALKISFANEIGNICKELAIDSHMVMEIFCKDEVLNISPHYFKPGFAYGGSCLPKDLKGLQTLAHDLYLDVPLIKSIDQTNVTQIERAIRLIYKYGDKNLGFLGLSFKAGTDDLRNSPAVSVIEILLGRGCNIKIYDKNINLALLTGTNKEYINARIPHLYQMLVQSPEEILMYSDVIIINTKENEFMDILKNCEDKMIIDLVRLSDEILKKQNYIGINW